MGEIEEREEGVESLLSLMTSLRMIGQNRLFIDQETGLLLNHRTGTTA